MNPFNKMDRDFLDYEDIEDLDYYPSFISIKTILQHYLIWRAKEVKDTPGLLFKELLKYDELAKWRFSDLDFKVAYDMFAYYDKYDLIWKIPDYMTEDLLIDAKEVIGLLGILAESMGEKLCCYALFNMFNSLFERLNTSILNILKTELEFLYVRHKYEI
ncbi:hypothetical protein EPTV-WA-187 [Eptesipox virus]|uniref:Uncharacterized protein n=1 Tax=Eptesipox virus TaxID=1329402 RepID=A0A220T6P6_9POXV|nr:hypothetical protein CG743_gp005 [Eptesipox virus]YP_009408138.1 hypothetical protein CG743_gp187 [Eptesipox virus]ASK51206.1 hypothetical protein EPTV-WA-005 [Eptesipox virus]ASK51388.1 hypothetical protein EPTV-WA-187 [Eptesipox virus]WAH70964.1 hypothetical protein CG743_gp005 [Eptesipox virus]WAH71146.1 hypothetical protein CG743_gp187 [Eptesipox virus]